MARLREASAPADLEAVRTLFAEYAQGVDEPCCFNGLERELAELPQAYLALFIAEENGRAAGCVGLRELDRGTAEMKRLYVRAPFRGLSSKPSPTSPSRLPGRAASSAGSNST